MMGTGTERKWERGRRHENEGKTKTMTGAGTRRERERGWKREGERQKGAGTGAGTKTMAIVETGLGMGTGAETKTGSETGKGTRSEREGGGELWYPLHQESTKVEDHALPFRARELGRY